MDASGTDDANREYYDAFSARYEEHRGSNDPGGYHELLDELEASFVSRFGTGKDVLEVGCGTGLVLERISGFAASARGVDLSPGMLAVARERGLDVVQGSATELPFEDDRFDVTCAFKVLAHVPDIHAALDEMARVTRPGGYVIAEFYNPLSLRGLVKRYGPAGTVAQNTNERQVYTRFDSPAAVRRLMPSNCHFVAARGARIVTPTAILLRSPWLRRALCAAERAVCDTPLAAFGGFYIAAMTKVGGASR